MSSILSKLGVFVASGLLAVSSWLTGGANWLSPQSSLGSAVSFNPTQAQPSFLAGAGVTAVATIVNLTAFTTRQGTPITTANIGGIGFATIDPGTVKEENISFTGITQNGNGTAQLTGVIRGLLPVYPYTASTTLAVAHSGGATVITSNSGAFYNQFNISANTSTITGAWTFSSTSIPQLSSNTTYAQNIANNFNLVDYGTLASTSIAGAVPATNANAGIVKIATGTDLANSNATTTYSLVAPSTLFSSTSKATIVPVTNASGTLADNFIGQAVQDIYNFLGQMTFASITFNGTTTFAKPTSSILYSTSSGAITGIAVGSGLSLVNGILSTQDANGHVNTTSTAGTPTLADGCSGGSIIGNDFEGHVHTPSPIVAAKCTLIFAHAYAAVPSCVATTADTSSSTFTAINGVIGNTTSVFVIFASGNQTGFNYICPGNPN